MPFQPWVEALERLLDALPEAYADRWLTAHDGALARLVLPDVDDPGRGEGRGADLPRRGDLASPWNGWPQRPRARPEKADDLDPRRGGVFLTNRPRPDTRG